MLQAEKIHSGADNRQESRTAKQESLLDISTKMALFIRVWNAIEGQNRDIIDFDLVPIPGYLTAFTEAVKKSLKEVSSKEERENVHSGFTEFQAMLQDMIPATQSEKLQLEFLSAKVDAHKAYLERKLGFLPDPLKFIERTMGVEPKIFSENVLLEQKEITASLFKPLGGNYNRENIEACRNRLVEEESILPMIRDNALIFIRELSDFLGVDEKSITPKYKTELVSKNDYWLVWVNGSWRMFTLQFNIHNRHKARRTDGKIMAMIVHEIAGHLAQMTSWLNAIKREELIPVLGLTSVHDPEQVTTEGIAQTLPYFVPEIGSKLTPAGKFEVEMEGLRQMVYNNVHIWANTKFSPDKELVEYIQSYCPAETKMEIKRQVKERTANTLKQAYLYSYGIGFYRHKQYAQQLNNEGRKELLRLIYRQPITPAQEDRFVQGLLNDPGGRYKAA